MNAHRYDQVLNVLAHYTPAERAECCYHIESRYCWDCGQAVGECECGPPAALLAAEPVRMTDPEVSLLTLVREAFGAGWFAVDPSADREDDESRAYLDWVRARGVPQPPAAPVRGPSWVGSVEQVAEVTRIVTEEILLSSSHAVWGRLAARLADVLAPPDDEPVGDDGVPEVASDGVVAGRAVEGPPVELDWTVTSKTRGPRPLDYVHDIYAGYAWLLFPWRGRWCGLARRDWRLRWMRAMHNCTATGVQ